MRLRPVLATGSLLLALTACSAGGSPDSTPDSTPATPGGEVAASASTDPDVTGDSDAPEAGGPPDPCTLLDRTQKKRLFPSGSTFARATWTRDLTGRDGNFYGCVGTVHDFRYARFGYALTPDAYPREYDQGLSPRETPGLGDRGYVREHVVDGYEAMAQTGDQTVFVVGMGARDHMHVVAALQHLIAESSDAMTSTPVHLEEPCPAADSPEVASALGTDIDVAIGLDHGDGIFCGYHDRASRTQLLLAAYDLDRVAGSLYEPGITKVSRRAEGEVRIASYDPKRLRYAEASLAWDGEAMVSEPRLGGDDRALFALGRRFLDQDRK